MSGLLLFIGLYNSIPMAKFVVPNSSYGSTFGVRVGEDPGVAASALTTSGNEIDFDTLNRRRFTDRVAFNEFYTIIKDSVKARLGHPVVRVELTNFQILTAIDEAISRLDYHAPDWCINYMTFQTQLGVGLYKLPKFVLNNLQYAAYKKTLLSIAEQSGTLEFDFFIKYFQENFLFQDFGVADFFILQTSLKTMRRVLGREGMFNVVNGEYLQLFPVPTSINEQVVVIFKALNTPTLHHYYINWLQRYATAVSKGILGQIRGKYTTLPSPAGGAQLNGAQLAQESEAEKATLLQELLTEIEEPPAAFTTFG